MQRRILIIDDHDDLATSLHEVFTHVGHFVHIVEDRRDALAIDNIETFDLVITDLDVEKLTAETNFNGNAPVCLPASLDPSHFGQRIKAFKICAANFRRDEFDEEEDRKSVV